MDDEREFLENNLAPVSAGFAVALFDAYPHLRSFAKIVNGSKANGQSLLIDIPSPTGDPARFLTIWTDEVDTPNIEFGPSHIHESPDSAGYQAIINVVEKIFAENLVIAIELGGDHSVHAFWLDLSLADALEDELTSPYSTGHVKIKSWAGTRDQEIQLSDLPWK